MASSIGSQASYQWMKAFLENDPKPSPRQSPIPISAPTPAATFLPDSENHSLYAAMFGAPQIEEQIGEDDQLVRPGDIVAIEPEPRSECSGERISPSFAPVSPGVPIFPGTPKRFNQAYVQKVISRRNRRLQALSARLNEVPFGRLMPDRDDITIGSPRQFAIAIMFLDICGFSERPNWYSMDQRNILAVMNIFLAEMLSIVRDFDGTFEKDSSDGLMAYFGKNERSVADAVRPAAEAAVIMHFVNDYVLTPWFQRQGISPVVFRIGIDYGPVTIASVGRQGKKGSQVVVGTAANIAGKLMKRIPHGGICIGDEVRKALPHDWASTCLPCAESSGFYYIQDNTPYTAWELTHRLSPPNFRGQSERDRHSERLALNVVPDSYPNELFF